MLLALTQDHVLRPKDVAALFISVTDYWYADSSNALFRKRAESYNLILNYLETGLVPDDMPYYLAYVIAKFRAEWIDLDVPDKSDNMMVVKVDDPNPSGSN